MSNTIQGYGAQFYPDQQVHAPDLNAIQYTSIQNLRNYLKNITKVFGVCLNSTADTALQVTCNNGGTLLSITAGTGIAPDGSIVIVPESPTLVSGSLSRDPLYYPARPTRTLFSTGITSAGTYYVNIYYAPLAGSPEPDDSGNTHYTRIYDSYRIAVEATSAASIATGLTLARVILDASGNLTTDATETGYLDGLGQYYSLFDERTGYQVYDEQKGDADAEIALLKTAVFEEELDKSVAFIFPAKGHSAVTKIHRNATILRMELYMELRTGASAGTVEFTFYYGPSPSAWNTTSTPLSTSTPQVVSIGPALNYEYTANDAIKLELTSCSDTVTRATATLVYKRR